MHKIQRIAVAFSIFLGFATTCKSQDIYADTAFLSTPDSISFFQSISTKDPLKAALYSAVLPGLGQAYNGDYWKIPIIYTGIIMLAHYIDYNHELYNQFRTSYIALRDNDPNTLNRFELVDPGRFNDRSMQRNRDSYRRNRDYLMIWAGVLYLLNIAEAHIAAHLKEFELNDALSMKIRPQINSSSVISRSVGISFAINF